VYSVTPSRIYVKNIADDQFSTVHFDIEKLQVKNVVDVMISEELAFVYLIANGGCLWICSEIESEAKCLMTGVW
jgi:hypothetical protein